MGLFDTLKKAATDALGNAVSNTKRNVVSNVTNAASSAIKSASTPKESKTFTFDSLPKTLDEMKNLPEASLDNPFKTAALTVCALSVFPENKEAAKEMLNFLKGPQPLTPREEQFLADRFMDGKKYIPFSYFEGASPANDYTPSIPYKITIFTNPYSYQDENYAMLHINSSGADSERQVKLRKKGDQWFLWEQFLLSDIRKSKSDDPWA
ncbi:MAG: hypothetical protein IKI29_06240 [Clostridia bacterium]|nr:hypothetical protein [Clostridia bacterium]